MFKNAAAATRGKIVSSADLWEDHATALRAAEEARAEVEAAQSARGDALIVALANESQAEREQARVRVDGLNARALDLENAAKAIKARAEEAEARERAEADIASWAKVDAAAQRQTEALERMDVLLEELCVLHATARECQDVIEHAIPKADRPHSWSHLAWGFELGRSIVLRAKLLNHEFDARVGGLECYVPRDFPSLAELGRCALQRFLSARDRREARHAS